MKDSSVSQGTGVDRISRVVSLLEQIVDQHSPAALATSFGLEDMVLLDMISKHARGVEVFTLDTGRLPEETYRLMDTVRGHYPVPIQVYCPPASELERYVRLNGPNAFYDSVAQRRECCNIRKVLPLRRALAGKQAWITGVRRAQSPTREEMQVKDWDEVNGLHKFSPLLDWELDDVWSYVKEENVPYNALHDRGYPSVGCAPCTRAIEPGEDIRSGRWWWEDGPSKECGIHEAGS